MAHSRRRGVRRRASRGFVSASWQDLPRGRSQGGLLRGQGEPAATAEAGEGAQAAARSAAAREINRELGYLSVLEARDAAGLTPAEAVAAGGAAVDGVLAMIDDCEWRLRRAETEEGKDTTMLPDPGELRRRLGIPAGSHVSAR
jgi:hypothetical protein